MMNVVALSFVFSTLIFTSSVWRPGTPLQEEEVVMREGHRLIVLEYQKEGLKEALKRATADTLDAATHSAKATGETIRHAAEDAATKAKHSVSSAFHSAENVKGDTQDALGSAKTKATETLESAKESVVEKKNEAAATCKDKLMDCKEKVKDLFAGSKAENVKESAQHALDSAKEGAVDMKNEAAITCKDKMKYCKEGVKNFFARSKEKQKDKSARMQENAENIREVAKERGESAVLKLREAMEQLQRMAPNAHDLQDVARNFEERFVSLLSNSNSDTRSLNGSGAFVSALTRWIPTSAFARNTARLAHMVAFCSVYGASVWVTFLSGHVLSQAVPRHQFGLVQSKIFPVYFKFTALATSMCLLALFALHPWLHQRWLKFTLLLSFICTLSNLLVFEPKATKVMFERLRLEKEECRGRDNADLVGTRGNEGSALNDEVKRKLAVVGRRVRVIHGYSSLCNVLCLASLTCHLALLASTLNL